LNEWLNALTRQEAESICSGMRAAVGFDELVQISGGPSPAGLSCLGSSAPRTGDWYVSWATCEIINLAMPGTGHPRWQPTIMKRGGGTPTNPTSLGSIIKRHLSSQRWEELKGLTNSNGQVKIPCHHLAFLASDAGEVGIPANVGHGASLSHLCDSRGCIRDGHMELALQHVDNLERQRCSGVTLIVAADLIIHEVPCAHGHGYGDLTLAIMRSCRKLRMVWLPDVSINALVANYHDIVDALTTPSPSQLIDIA